MKVSFHCFAYEVKIEPAALNFPFKGHTLSVRVHKKDKEEGLMLELSREATIEEFSTEGEVRDDQGNFIEKRLRPYKELITEAAQLIEGLFSIFYFVTPPKFDSDKILVNVIAENPEEEQLIKSGKITGGFGNIFQPPSRPLYQLKDNIPAAATTAVDHLPALSFLAQAIRSQERNDNEVAFFLYFRIVGVFYPSYFNEDGDDFATTQKHLREKIEKDWNRKIVLPEVQKAFENYYLKAKELLGDFPERFINAGNKETDVI